MAKRQTLNVSKIKINPIEEPDRHFLRIYIPTYKRLQTQRTFAYLPDALRRRTVLVVSKEEAKILRPLGFPVLVCPLQGQGSVGHVRQWIIDNHDTERYGHKLVMMDDDIKFDRRREDDVTKFLPTTDADIIDIFRTIDKKLNKYAHVGVLSREGANRVLDNFKIATRMTRVLAYNLDILEETEARFDRLPVMEDFDVILTLLESGYPNYVITKYVNGQMSTGYAGGCSEYRTSELQKKCARRLKRLHPDFVNVVEKAPTSAWPSGRTDVLVQWKKAYLSSQNES